MPDFFDFLRDFDSNNQPPSGPPWGLILMFLVLVFILFMCMQANVEP